MYGDIRVTKFVNHLMYDGKKNASYEIFYSALSTVARKLPHATFQSHAPQPHPVYKNGDELTPLDVWKVALENITPDLEVKSRRVGGATFQVPTEIRPDRKESISMKNMISYARKRGGKTMSDKLSAEILDAFNNQGGAYKRKEDMHRMAEANRAFAYFRF
jgi:small subunit ribosomal protein S7